MRSRKPSQRHLLSSCAEVHEDDGADPRYFFREGRNDGKVDRKMLQLCAQVADTLNNLLPECHDELVQLLQVATVTPTGDPSQLLVTVYPAVEPATPFDPREILARLAQVTGWLRSEVTATITRKRAPKLLFHVVTAASRKEGQ